MELIRVNHLKKDYQQGVLKIPAVRGVSFSIQKGDFAALVGPSGSGKTTLLNMIGVLDTPDEGEIFLEDQCLNTLKEKEKTRFRLYHIGFVFQFYNLIPVFTALENVEYTLMLQGMDKKTRQEKALSLMSEMRIEELKNRFPRELSGGQQQRVAVVRALVSNPKVVLADEPTANLDSESADILLDIMQEMAVKKETTFLFSTHDKRVMDRAKRLIRLRDGRLEEN
ncbi:MAG TPA: macrolide ABC transporter ATP-binding protein [Spirochaetia bacterium]|nr:MAG: macrolide ABC transporter ATP-binding protein [Spirochaetes bacterium GWB1_36_13]HCL56067.1 macrolide ABC transporter ATP-binding protein [Spirochaetia bacterium]